MFGSGPATSWRLIRSERKKRQIHRALSGLPQRSVVLVEDETDLLLFPPLRAMWSPRGQAAQVMLSGWNARRVVFGCMNLATGHRLFQIRHHQRAQDFQAFLRQVHQRYRGWQVTLLLDSDSSHTANGSQAMAAQMGVRLLWLPKRAPELNPMDTLWGQGKDAMNANKQCTNIEEQAESFVTYLSSLSNKEALTDVGHTVRAFLPEACSFKKLLRTCLALVALHRRR